MHLKRYLLRYFLPFFLVYLGMLGLTYIPSVKTTIFTMARQTSGKVLNTLLPKAQFVTDPNLMNSSVEPTNILIGFANREAVQQALQAQQIQGKERPEPVQFESFTLHVEQFYIIPLLFLVSLILITPIPRKRKVWSLLIGIGLLYLYQVFRLYFVGLEHVADAELGIYEKSSGSLEILYRMRLTLQTLSTYVIPVLIWGLVCFRKGDWRQVKLFKK